MKSKGFKIAAVVFTFSMIAVFVGYKVGWFDGFLKEGSTTSVDGSTPASLANMETMPGDSPVKDTFPDIDIAPSSKSGPIFDEPIEFIELDSETINNAPEERPRIAPSSKAGPIFDRPIVKPEKEDSAKKLKKPQKQNQQQSPEQNQFNRNK